MTWDIRHHLGDAGTFHAGEPEATRSVTFQMVTSPTLVLGSSQTDDDVDRTVATALGVQVVRRRSGGGAVLLMPGEYVWADIVVPVDDELWSVDVAKSMVWVGECWRAALASLGVEGSVHHGALVRDEWSSRVCWTSVGTGELMAGERKLVGISQRRTRAYARFQSQVHLRWRPEFVSALVPPPRPSAASLAGSAAVVSSSAEAVRAALVACLP